jgi:hypothetical protein
LSRRTDGRLGRCVSSHRELNIQSGSKRGFVAVFRNLSETDPERIGDEDMLICGTFDGGFDACDISLEA